MTHLTAEMRFWHKTKPTIHSAQIKGREGGSELSVSLLLVTAEVATNSLGPRNQHKHSQAQTLRNNLETELLCLLFPTSGTCALVHTQA